MRTKIFIVIAVLSGFSCLFLACASEQITSSRLYIQQEDWEKAEEQLLMAMELEPENPEVYFLLGKEIYGRRGEWEKMNEMFDKALSVGADTKLPEGFTVRVGVENAVREYWSQYYNRGADYYNTAVRGSGEDRVKNLDRAIEALETAKRISPSQPGSYKSLVFAYLQAGRSDLVDATLDEALKMNPEDIDLLIAASGTVREAGDLDRAIELLEKAVRIHPSDSRAARALADAFYEKGDKDGAILAYKRAIREDPENLDLHFNLGVLYLQVDDFDFAEEEFQRVLRLNPEDMDATIGIGEAYERMEQWEDAEFYYGKAIRLDPENPVLLRAMARVIYHQGRIEEAEEYLNRAKGIE